MPDRLNTDLPYVSKSNWLVSAGREDLIDEIADEFERRTDQPTVASGRHAFWARETPGWPTRAAS